MKKIYCAGPMAGLDKKLAQKKFMEHAHRLESIGYKVMVPMQNEPDFDEDVIPKFLEDSNLRKRIFLGDLWMVRQSDIIFCDFRGATEISVGSVSELAWGYLLGKNIVILMEKDNVHKHGFICEEATVIFEDECDACRYLDNLNSLRNL